MLFSSFLLFGLEKWDNYNFPPYHKRKLIQNMNKNKLLTNSSGHLWSTYINVHKVVKLLQKGCKWCIKQNINEHILKWVNRCNQMPLYCLSRSNSMALSKIHKILTRWANFIDYFVHNLIHYYVVHNLIRYYVAHNLIHYYEIEQY